MTNFALDSTSRILAHGARKDGGSAGELLDAIEASAAKHHDRAALRIRAGAGWRETTYGEMRDDARRLAAWMMEAGVRRGTPVALVAESRPEWVVAFLGAMMSGATLVPIDPKLTAVETTNLLRHSQAELVLTTRAAERMARAATARVSPAREIVVLDAEDDRALAPALRPRQMRPPRHRAAHETALVVYTSGTTGDPKGVETTFGNLAYQMHAMDRAIGPMGRERFLSVLPLNHLYELICGLLTPLLRGAAISYADTLLPDDVAALLRDERITSVVGVPLLFRALKRGIERRVRAEGDSAAKRFDRAMALARFVPGSAARRALFSPLLSQLGPELRALYSGGAALDRDVAIFFERLGVPVYQGYGMTETSPVIATNGPRANRVGSVGRPLSGVEVRIVRKSAADPDGEIQTRGPHVMAGYLRRADLSREAIDANGWLSTGDLGHLDDDGYLWVTGRSKDLVVLGGGKKVHPDEVEDVLSRGARFKEVCVVGAPARSAHAQGFDEVCAVVVPDDALAQEHEGPQALHAAVVEEVNRLAQSLSSFKRPTRVVVRAEPLPRTATRKLKRPLVVEWLRRDST